MNIKNRFYNTLTSLFLLLSIGCANGQKPLVDNDQLPTSISIYITKHFPKHKIVQAILDKELFSKSYKVLLSENVQLDFDQKNQIEEIKSTTRLPDSVIPNTILTYVKTNYPENAIIAWERDNREQSIELDNKIELTFNKKGKLIEIDLD